MPRCQSRPLGLHKPQLHWTPAQGGASIWVRTPDWIDGHLLAVRARAQGVLIEPGDVFFVDPPRPCPYFRLRLSSIDVAQIEPGIVALQRALSAMEDERG